MKKLIILDLNGVLISRTYDKDSEPYDGAIRVNNHLMWLRPHCQEFFEYLFEHYTVAVWSSIGAWNMTNMPELVFGEKYMDKLLFVWDQDKCWRRSDPESRFVKPLEDVWRAYPEYNETNTVLIDDSIKKAERNPSSTVYCPETWTCECGDNDALGKGGVIYEWLVEGAMCKKSGILESSMMGTLLVPVAFAVVCLLLIMVNAIE